jgi:hypothetical protein
VAAGRPDIVLERMQRQQHHHFAVKLLEHRQLHVPAIVLQLDRVDVADVWILVLRLDEIAVRERRDRRPRGEKASRKPSSRAATSFTVSSGQCGAFTDIV